MGWAYAQERIGAKEYLHKELLSDSKHQLIDGEIYAMAGASENHNLLALNSASEWRNQLRWTSCRTFMADMKVKVGGDFYYPDVMVVCGQDDDDVYYKTAPVVIVEVLSNATRRFDQSLKRMRCQAIPSLQEYVLVEQDKGEIEVFSRRDNWQACYYYLGDEITFHSLGVTVPVESIYEQVNNDDVLAYLQQKQRN